MLRTINVTITYFIPDTDPTDPNAFLEDDEHGGLPDVVSISRDGQDITHKAQNNDAGTGRRWDVLSLSDMDTPAAEAFYLDVEIGHI